MNTNKRKVGILIFENAEVLDFCGPFEVFSVTAELNDYKYFDVSIVAKEKKPVKAVNGLSVNPDYSFEDAPDFDILIIAGGAGTRYVIEDKEFMRWTKKQFEKSELVLSICSGARILGKLGYLDNQDFSTHHGVYEHMEEIAPLANPRPDLRYTDNGKFFTSGGISAGIDLSFYVVQKLLGKGIMLKTAAYMEYRVYSAEKQM